jgi:glycosyltransferase involved in cell wall biosynthesis
MRLLYLTCDPGVPVLGHKGASVHVREMVDAFAAAGASVLVASPRIEPDGNEPSSSAELVHIDPVRPARYQSVASLRKAIAAQTRRVQQIARQHGAEAIYERMSLFGASGVRAARLLGLPHVLEMNAPLCDEARRFRSLPHPREATRLEAEMCTATDHIFPVSDALSALLVQAGVPPAKVTVAPNGVDRRKFLSRKRPQPLFTIGFLGSLKPWHGVDVLLSAFRLALASRPELRLEIVGTGPERASIEAADLPPDRLGYHGALPHAAAIELLAGWDVGVAPFLPVPDFYFSPLKVVEYMAAGVCPVGSSLGQIKTLLGDGRGVLVEPGDVEALSDAIVRLAAHRADAAEIGARARTYALASFSWQRNARQALRVLAGSPVAVGPP